MKIGFFPGPKKMMEQENRRKKWSATLNIHIVKRHILVEFNEDEERVCLLVCIVSQKRTKQSPGWVQPWSSSAVGFTVLW